MNGISYYGKPRTARKLVVKSTVVSQRSAGLLDRQINRDDLIT